MSKNSSTDFRRLLLLALLAAFGLLVYAEIFRYRSFGPEFPLFYFYTPASAKLLLRSYTYLDQMWYRPTAFALPYWLGQHLIDWHDLAAWKFYYFLTTLATGFAIFWLVGLLFPRQRAGAFLAAAYFIAQPSLYALAMDVSSFDSLHILFTVLCVGFYIRALSTRRLTSVNTILAWLLFVAALTSKEVALAIPIYLLLVGAVLSRRTLAGREALRLVPFFAIVPVYYVLHIARIPASNFTSSGIYRISPNWDIILANLRKLPLWIVRIYAFTGETLHERMYLSNLTNNLAGCIAFVAVAAWWLGNLKKNRSYIAPCLLMIGWMAVFLPMPIYAGGFFWHANLPIAGYAVLFGIAVAHYWERITSSRWRALTAAIFLLGWIALCGANMHVELYEGTHAAGFRINHALIDAPPVAPVALGSKPLVYIDDRLGIGAWWYGCYGRLFNFVYLRRDIDEQIFRGIEGVPAAARVKWLAHGNAFYFRYDGDYRWHDATADFRRRDLK